MAVLGDHGRTRRPCRRRRSRRSRGETVVGSRRPPACRWRRVPLKWRARFGDTAPTETHPLGLASDERHRSSRRPQPPLGPRTGDVGDEVEELLGRLRDQPNYGIRRHSGDEPIGRRPRNADAAARRSSGKARRKRSACAKRSRRHGWHSRRCSCSTGLWRKVPGGRRRCSSHP